jgi:phosphopantothenoylcysteine decarboxylase/phosphopantothenate--cysteine ligase
MELTGKRIILGITGSIAAYKAVYLLRLLIGEGASVQVVMTPAAREFVGPVTFSALSGKPVLTEFFKDEGGDWNSHVGMGVDADLMIVAPVTATTMGKMAGGIADNLLVATYLSARCPVILVPAMDMDMYAHPSNSKNILSLKSFGNHILEPSEGELASGLEGKGRMQEPEEIIRYIRDLPSGTGERKKKLLNKRILLTAGPTHEMIDPVRFIGNYSSGKMGYAIAEAFAAEGATVHLISGPVSVKTDNKGIKVVHVTSANEMFEACKAEIGEMDVAVFNAAVADYTPVSFSGEKKKRETGEWSLQLKPTLDIAGELGRSKKEGQLFIGFALEADQGVDQARKKLKDKNLDLIVLNSLQEPGAGFGTDTNKVTMIDRQGGEEVYELKPKREVAMDLVTRVIKMLGDA